jgi:hypothetical protein
MLLHNMIRRKTHFKSEIWEDFLVAKWWARQDLNLRPHAYQACALTNWATGPFILLCKIIGDLWLEICNYFKSFNLKFQIHFSEKNGGGYRVRTDDILLAKQMLYQLS